MLIWLVFGVFGYVQFRGVPPQPQPYAPYWWHGHSVFLFILLFILGWHSFGFMIRGP